jgi:hypothetical protein
LIRRLTGRGGDFEMDHRITYMTAAFAELKRLTGTQVRGEALTEYKSFVESGETFVALDYSTGEQPALYRGLADGSIEPLGDDDPMRGEVLRQAVELLGLAPVTDGDRPPE